MIHKFILDTDNTIMNSANNTSDVPHNIDTVEDSGVSLRNGQISVARA